MQLEQRINAFVKLGVFINQFSTISPQKIENVQNNAFFFDSFNKQITHAKMHNAWFNFPNIAFSLKQWADALTENKLKKWLKPYDFNSVSSKKIAIIMAGNIPLVGFHDFLSVLISGHSVLVKQSSNDKHLLPIIAKYLESVEPEFKGKIVFTDSKLENFDAVIATGSNNTAKYFDYYFKNHPSIIRKNRNSVAVLTGNETETQMQALSKDVFRYYGLGCRNVSKLFVPDNYNFDAFFKGIYHWNTIINDVKYANNYDYNKAVYLMSEFDILENGFLMIKEDKGFSSPIATVFYEYYTDLTNLKQKLQKHEEQIQCIVANVGIENEIPFGKTQQPQLSDYADNIDTIAFLLKI